MIKFRLYYDKDKEQAWLNEMVERGWAVEHFFLGFYTFASCQPGEYIYQLDMLDNWAGEKGNYQEFMSELKIETVAQWWRWVYLRKKVADGPFDLYTDNDSKITQYKRIRSFFKIFALIELLLFMFELFAYLVSGQPLILLLAVMIGVFTWAIGREAIRCNQKIISLQNSSGDTEQGSPGLSPWIGVGLLINALNIVLQRFFFPFSHAVALTISVLGCFLILAGVFQEGRKLHSK